MEKMTMFGGFIDMKKEFDGMDRDRCLVIVRARVIGEKALWLITIF